MSNKGQSLVELAISFVIIMLLLAGTVELGISLFQYIQLRDAAQEGALFGSICQNYAMIEQRARHASTSPLDLTKEVVVEIAETDDEGIKVSMKHNHKVFMPFASAFAGEVIALNASVTDTILVRDTICD